VCSQFLGKMVNSDIESDIAPTAIVTFNFCVPHSHANKSLKRFGERHMGHLQQGLVVVLHVFCLFLLYVQNVLKNHCIFALLAGCFFYLFLFFELIGLYSL